MFIYPHLVGEAYGEFLLHTDTGKIGYLDAISSVEFSELSEIVDELLQSTTLSTRKQVKVLHKIFNITCDLANDNSEFQLDVFPHCPHCNSQKMYSWEEINPPQYVDVDIAQITHHRWNQLDAAQKKTLAAEAIATLFKTNTI